MNDRIDPKSIIRGLRKFFIPGAAHTRGETRAALRRRLREMDARWRAANEAAEPHRKAKVIRLEAERRKRDLVIDRAVRYRGGVDGA